MNCNCPSCTKFVLNECTVKNQNIKDGKCTHIITNNISGMQHRFYRGLILPALTESLGESNLQYTHDFILKPEWIYRQTGEYYFKVNNYNEIPEKYQGNARIITVDGYTIKNNKTVETVLIKGYVPSMANFTRAETKDYFKFCEVLLEEIGGAIPTDQNQEYQILRKKVIS